MLRHFSQTAFLGLSSLVFCSISKIIVNPSMLKKYIIILALVLLGNPFHSFGQISSDSIPTFEYTGGKVYEIGGIKVSGAKSTDENAIIAISGLRVGDKVRIPGGEIPRALKALWKLRLFTDVEIFQDKKINEVLFLEIYVKELPRYTRHSFTNIKKSKHSDLNDIVARYITKGTVVNENVKASVCNAIEKHFIEKGFLDTKVTVSEQRDEKAIDGVKLIFNVTRDHKVKIDNITFDGNNNVGSMKLRKKMSKTHRKWKIFSSSKFIEKEYESDKVKIIDYYNNIGFRDAIITQDTVWRKKGGNLRIHMDISEGKRYYFRNVAWKGNSIYDTKVLSNILGIKRGDVYNKELLDTRLKFSKDGRDISSVYLDDGYLFFNVDPVEVSIEGDSIDLEMRIYEGPQATIDRVVIKGNDRTHEHVIRRELRTRPGQKFSRSDIVRSQRELVNLGYFNPETMKINTPVNAQRGTVDIEYEVNEKPTDQLELSAGYQPRVGNLGGGVIGTLGVSFNNFSTRNILKKSAWSPLPQGDGQRLSLRAQTNAQFFQSYNFSFTEPWLGGKRRNVFTLAGSYFLQNFQQSLIADKGGSASLGTLLKFPDDNFTASIAMNIRNLTLQNYSFISFLDNQGRPVRDGNFNNFSLKATVARNTIFDPLFPKSGSLFELSVQATPPYTSLGRKVNDFSNAQDVYKYLEYHKWRLNLDWYNPIIGKLVLRANAKVGMLGYYNRRIGTTPFERFLMVGDPLNSINNNFLVGRDVVYLRGYNENDFPSNASGSSVFNKYTLELRYPISLNPSATIYVLGFAQGGNVWNRFRDFNPFEVRRSVGVGARFFLPMFGLLGFDYGYGLDRFIPSENPRLSEYAKFSFIFGFEPD
jgi:outer membrane protein insertion porin family